MLIDILQNAALLSIAAIVVYWVFQTPSFEASLRGSVVLGLMYGITTFLVTVTPIMLDDGATIDARAGPVILAGMLGGPIAALIAAFFGGFARWYVGGSFAFSGVVVFFLYAAVGTIVWRRLFRSILGSDVDWRRIGLSVVLGAGSAALMFFLIQPSEKATEWIKEDFPWIAVANTLSVLLCAATARIAISVARQKMHLAQTLQTLELAKKAGGVGLWIYDINDKTVTWDDTNKKMHFIEKKENTGSIEDWSRAVHPEDLEMTLERFDRTIDENEPFSLTYRVIAKDGAIRTLKGNGLVQRDNRSVPVRVVGTNYDITPILEKDKELLETKSIAAQAQKLDTVGKLTGGVAHDFNNLLAIIQGNLEFILNDEGVHELSSEERLDILTSAISASRRGGELTHSMLAFARKSRLEPQSIRLNEVVRETENWIVRAIPSTIQIDTSLQHAIWPLSLDLASLQSAIVNIIVNARDAMPKGGKLTIETSNVRINDEYIRLLHEEVPKGRYVMLAITDTGTGIDPEFLPNVFEPFVSSKPMSLGSGLGLSMVEGFARQSGGFVKIYSEVGSGTCVKLFFPVNAEAGENADEDQKEITIDTGQKSSGHILVAEDQIEVLAIVVRSLKSAGYSVDAAPSGDAAYKMFLEFNGYDLLLTDVVMPGDLLGPELARACRALKPDLPVVFMSGYASEATVHGNGLRAEDIRLMKPVPRVELISTIRECLEKASVSGPDGQR